MQLIYMHAFVMREMHASSHMLRCMLVHFSVFLVCKYYYVKLGMHVRR